MCARRLLVADLQFIEDKVKKREAGWVVLYPLEVD
jgi:hypothetical protein